MGRVNNQASQLWTPHRVFQQPCP